MILTHLFQRITRALSTADGHTATDRVLYELWSTDTFEGRTFLCEVYKDYDEACAALKRCLESAPAQDEDLRDTYWLVETDATRIAERERVDRERFKV